MKKNKHIKTRYSILLLVFLSAFSTFNSCDKNDDNTNDLNNKQSNVEPLTEEQLVKSKQKIIDADNSFGIDLFNKIIKDEPEDKNVFISPVSIGLALTMTYNGADNETKTAMEEALHLSGLSLNEINQSYQNIMYNLLSVDPNVTLSVANSIWYRQGFEVEKDFIDINKTYFNAEVTELDFAALDAVDIINGWVENKTENKIIDLLSFVSPSHVMFLINAIYFNGIWQTQFDKEDTFDGPFELSSGSQKELSYMHLMDTIDYYSNDIFCSIKLPYGNGDYNMVIMLPEYEKSTTDILDILSPESWSDWNNSFEENEVTLNLPKFSFEYEKELNDILTTMGMGIAFTSDADFTKIRKSGGLAIDFVKHKAFIDVNEEGTEAAAATVVAIIETSVNPNQKYFNVNRPFVFAITEKNTNALIFIGRVVEP